jgi:hypothetical protein
MFRFLKNPSSGWIEIKIGDKCYNAVIELDLVLHQIAVFIDDLVQSGGATYISYLDLYSAWKLFF